MNLNPLNTLVVFVISSNPSGIDNEINTVLTKMGIDNKDLRLRDIKYIHESGFNRALLIFSTHDKEQTQ